MTTKFLIEVDGLTLWQAGKFILKDISFKIKGGECMCITGTTGSGKSKLLDAITRHRFFYPKIKFSPDPFPRIVLINHQHQFRNLSGINSFYYQQRFNSSESEDALTVMDELKKEGCGNEEIEKILDRLGIGYVAGSPLIQLSNGEHKRVQLARALLKKADWLLLDNPFTGLDPEARKMLEDILDKIRNNGVQILMVSNRYTPQFVTHVLEMGCGMLTAIHPREKFVQRNSFLQKSVQQEYDFSVISTSDSEDKFRYMVRMRNVSVQYHQRFILKDINWEVRSGEAWTMAGPNGSGKSTLLSLITGDNPQAFANDIYLFDRKKGTGETIWDIKKKIGYVSPELHQHFDKSFTCLQVVTSGLFDTIGLFRKINSQQRDRVMNCLEIFGLTTHADKPLASLSFGLQRWVMLARAIVKNPPLLVLDEPCQGLDEALSEKFLSLVEQYCAHQNKALIYVTHVEEEIPNCTTHVLKLENGKIKEKKRIWKKSLPSLQEMG